MGPDRISMAQIRQPRLENGAHLERAHIGVTGLRGRHDPDPALFWSKSREQKEEERMHSPMKHALPGGKALGASAFNATLRGFSPGIVRQGH